MKEWRWHHSIHARNYCIRLMYRKPKSKKEVFDELMKTGWVNERTAWCLVYTEWHRVEEEKKYREKMGIR